MGGGEEPTGKYETRIVHPIIKLLANERCEERTTVEEEKENFIRRMGDKQIN